MKVRIGNWLLQLYSKETIFCLMNYLNNSKKYGSDSYLVIELMCGDEFLVEEYDKSEKGEILTRDTIGITDILGEITDDTSSEIDVMDYLCWTDTYYKTGGFNIERNIL